MATVVNGPSDFVLFPADIKYSLQSNQYQDLASEAIMSSAQDLSNSFFQSQSAYDMLEYNLNSPQFARQSVPSGYENMKQQPRDLAVRPTPTVSPSSYSQPFDHPPSIISSTPGTSAQSSSADESPSVSLTHQLPESAKWSGSLNGLGPGHGTIHHNMAMQENFAIAGIDGDTILDEQKYHNFVDPSLIQQFGSHQDVHLHASRMMHQVHHLPSQRLESVSPVTSATSEVNALHGISNARHGTISPFLNSDVHRYTQSQEPRRYSVASSHSGNSFESLSPGGMDEEGREKSRCRDCGRLFKDLKAHMLTHQSERPEKCPIATCSYHIKGFARKYDKNRHTLTHYKGTMVCGFCPGSGSAIEKSFNRADVFKRHLTSLHGVEQTPPNSRRKAPNSSSTKRSMSHTGEVTGKCSTCSATFENAQDFYEHLDDCVLRVVQQEEPSEAINERILRAVNEDQNVQDTLDRHMLPTEIEMNHDASSASEGDEFEGEDEDIMDSATDKEVQRGPPRNYRSGKGSIMAKQRDVNPNSTFHQGGLAHGGGGKGISKVDRLPGPKGRGLTASKGGVPLTGKGRRRRKHYPASWGCSAEQMKMKKRVLCVYDGPRRLWKDDMMLDNEFEVRMRINDGKSYVTDLDVETVKRAEAFHAATDEEKGPWTAEDAPDDEVDIDKLMS